jgi:hypothetical protein
MISIFLEVKFYLFKVFVEDNFIIPLQRSTFSSQAQKLKNAGQTVEHFTMQLLMGIR